MRVLVTGGAGFIGSHVADALVERGDEVSVADDLSSGSRENLNPRADFSLLDIRDPDAPSRMAELAPQAIVHMAAQMSVGVSVRDPLYDAGINVIGSLSVLEAARRNGARVVFASSGGTVYGEPDVIPTPETSPTLPVSPYGVAKLAVERYLHAYEVQHGLGYAALRLANVYGPRQTPHGEAGVVAIFGEAMLTDREPVINGDGRYTRDYVYVADVVSAVLAALDSAETGAFNVGTGREVDVNEIHRRLVEISGVAVPERHGPERLGDARRSALDHSLITQRLGWVPRVQLEEGLGMTVDWIREKLAAAPRS